MIADCAPTAASDLSASPAAVSASQTTARIGVFIGYAPVAGRRGTAVLFTIIIDTAGSEVRTTRFDVHGVCPDGEARNNVRGITMQQLPHRYTVSAQAGTNSNVELSGEGLPNIESAPPAEFGGPGNLWSPESLLVAAIADCFVLSFTAIARASKFEWTSLTCRVEGVLDRVESVTRFTEFSVHAELDAPAGSDERMAKRLLEKAERSCLITNSLNSDVHLQANVSIAR